MFTTRSSHPPTKTASPRFSSFWAALTTGLAACGLVLASATSAHAHFRSEILPEPVYWLIGFEVEVTDARSKQTKLAYDNGNRLMRRTLPGGQSESFGFDAAGDLTTHTDSLNRAASFKYDDANRPIEKTLPDGSRIITTYTQSGQVDTQTDARGATRQVYDSLDRLTRKISPEGEIRYAYDENGNRLTETVIPAQAGIQARTVSYGYDDANRLASVTADNKQTTYGYDANGNRERISHPNNLTTRYEYDTRNRLTRLTHTRTSDGSILADYRYTLAPNGQRTQVEESDGQGILRTLVYTYDDLSRLKQEQISHRDTSKNRTTSYTYDSVGNRLTKVIGSVTTSYAYDDNDRLTTETTGSTVIAHSYDANGNTTRKETRTSNLLTSVSTYAYDAENRLIEVKQGTSDATLMLHVRHQYDADGNRIKTIQADGASIAYLVDTNRPYAEVLEEIQTSTVGTSRVSYVHGDDLISQTRASAMSGDVSYYHADGLGSTRLLTNDQGTVTDSYAYEAFGTLTEQTGNTPNSYLFTGEPRDPATGFYYLRARWMDPEVGRFITKDTFQGIAGDPLSLHKYLYANADPVNRVDPSGHFGLGASIGAVAGVLLTAAIGHQVFQVHTNYEFNRGSHPHSYDFTQEICSTQEGFCTVEDVYRGLLYYPAPLKNVPSAPIDGNTISELNDFYISVLGKVGLKGFGPNLVRHQIGTRSVVNITRPTHVFHDGTVERSIVEAEGVISIRSKGAGVNRTQLLARANEVGARPIFHISNSKLVIFISTGELF